MEEIHMYVFNIKYTFEIEKFHDRPSGSRPPRSGRSSNGRDEISMNENWEWIKDYFFIVVFIFFLFISYTRCVKWKTQGNAKC